MLKGEIMNSMNLIINKKGFTLIELLVVVAIIGILAAVGTVAYQGYTLGTKKNATMLQHKEAAQFMNNSLALCDVQGGGTLELTPTISIDCDINNTSGGINSLNDIFISYFLEAGYKNPYGEERPVVYTGRNSSEDTDGRMRFDETDCAGDSSRKRIAFWVKTHKDYYPLLIEKDGWCN